jgi:hypothetical protein
MARAESRPVTVHTIAKHVGVSPSAVSTVLANRHEERRLVSIPPLLRGADGTGVVTGTVSNAATQNLLEGAKIEAPKLGRLVLTDNTGRFVLSGAEDGFFYQVKNPRAK